MMRFDLSESKKSENRVSNLVLVCTRFVKSNVSKNGLRVMSLTGWRVWFMKVCIAHQVSFRTLEDTFNSCTFKIAVRSTAINWGFFFFSFWYTGIVMIINCAHHYTSIFVGRYFFIFLCIKNGSLHEHRRFFTQWKVNFEDTWRQNSGL